MAHHKEFGKLIFDDSSDATEHIYLFQRLIKLEKVIEEIEIKERFAYSLSGVPPAWYKQLEPLKSWNDIKKEFEERFLKYCNNDIIELTLGKSNRSQGSQC